MSPTKALSLLLAIALPCQAVVIYNGDVGVQYLGRSGQIKLFPRSDNSTKFVKIKWDKIEELNAQGRKVQFVNNFASQDFEWFGPYSSQLGGNNATRVDLRAFLSVGGNTVGFNISTWLINNDTVVHNGNQTLNVTRNSIKFTVDIQDWPFQNTANVLTFGAKLLVPGNPGRPQRNRTRGGEKVRFGTGDLIVVDQAVVDGENRNISSSVEEQGAQLLVEWTFPSFQNTLNYDPSFSLNGNEADGGGEGGDGGDSGDNTDDTGVIVGSVFGVLAAVAIIGVVVYYYCRARKRAQQDRGNEFQAGLVA